MNSSKIWIDATSFIRWRRPPVGIIRVEQELIKWSLNNGINVSFFKYCPVRHKFVIVDKSIILSQLVNQKFCRNKIKIEIKNYAKDIIRDFYKILQICIIIRSKRKGHSTPNSSFENVRKLTYPFKENDIILCAGINARLNQDILSIKNSLKLSYYAVCHDLIPVKFPHLYVGDPQKFSHYLTELGKGVDNLFCVSQCTERDFKNFALDMKFPCPSTSVVTLGCEIRQTYSLDAPGRMKLFTSPYILFVSTIERRKNHISLYKAWLNLIESGRKNLPKLVWVGMKGWKVKDLLSDINLDPRIKESIFILSEIRDAELSELYQNALFTVYPSYYEGWGLPIAESLNYGKMAIVSSSSSMPEVGKDLVDYVHPYDIVGWAKRIAFYLDNPDELARKEQDIREKYQKHSWEDFSKQIFTKIAEDRRG